jgi:energy-coupling factor transporter ATP-binding protein EcfA2
MAQLIGLGIENFRIFKDYTEFDFAPLTLLTGANNSGKSSLIKALLLLAVNAKEENLRGLNFLGKLVETHLLGSFNLSLNHFSENKTMKFELFYKIDDKRYKLLMNYEKTNGNGNRLSEFGILRLNDITQEYFYIHRILYHQEHQTFTSFLGIAYFIQQKFIDKLSPKDYVKNDNTDARNINFISEETQKIITALGDIDNTFLNELNTNIIYWFSIPYRLFTEDELYIKNVYNKFHYEKISRNAKLIDMLRTLPTKQRTNFSENLAYKPFFEALGDLTVREILKEEYADYLLEIPNDAYNLLQELRECLDFEYESATRANARREYKTTSEGTPFNELLVRFNKKEFTENSKEKEFINHWVNKFGLADKVEFIWDELRGTQIKMYKNAQVLDLADLGFGVTQLLPILIHIVICKTDYLVLEEPETNLHPDLQSKLADLLADAHKIFGIKFIIETHSEYLVRKLRVLTKRGDIKPTYTSIYYFGEKDQSRTATNSITKISIDKNGSLSDNFGNGFINESDNLVIELYDLPNL